MTDPENGGGSIRFSAKQLFEKLDDRLERIDDSLQVITIKLDSKAERSDFERLKTDVAIHHASSHAAGSKHEERIISLENFRSKAVGILIGVSLVSAGTGLGVAKLLKL